MRRLRGSTHTSGGDKVVLWITNNFSSLYPAEKYPPDRFVQSKSRFGIRNLPKIGLEYRGWIREQPIKSKKPKLRFSWCRVCIALEPVRWSSYYHCWPPKLIFTILGAQFWIRTGGWWIREESIKSKKSKFQFSWYRVCIAPEPVRWSSYYHCWPPKLIFAILGAGFGVRTGGDGGSETSP